MTEPDVVTCSLCGRQAPTAETLSWLLDVDPRRGRQLTCPDCARRHLRSIEAKLDPEYW